MGANTEWERVEVEWETGKFLRGEYQIWSRLAEGEHIFVVVPDGQQPKSGDGGYFSINSALKAKGLR